LYFRVGSLDLDKILVSVLKFSVAAIGAGLVIQILKIAVWPFIDMTTFVGVFIQFSVAASGGVIAYICLCHLFRSEELLSAIAIFKKRLSVKKVKLADQGEARGL